MRSRCSSLFQPLVDVREVVVVMVMEVEVEVEGARGGWLGCFLLNCFFFSTKTRPVFKVSSSKNQETYLCRLLQIAAIKRHWHLIDQQIDEISLSCVSCDPYSWYWSRWLSRRGGDSSGPLRRLLVSVFFPVTVKLWVSSFVLLNLLLLFFFLASHAHGYKPVRVNLSILNPECTNVPGSELQSGHISDPLYLSCINLHQNPVAAPIPGVWGTY